MNGSTPSINPLNVVRLEVGSISKAQLEVHTDNTGIPLNHLPQIEKIAMGSKIWSFLEASTNKDISIFKPNHELHVLETLSIVINIPELSLEDELHKTHRIRFDDNLVHRIVNFSELVTNKEVSGTLSLHILNIIRATQVPSNRRALYDKMIGNRPELTNWTTSIAATKIDAPLLFDFCTDPRKGIPLHRLKAADKTCEINFRFVLELADLLICEVTSETGARKIIPFDPSMLKKTGRKKIDRIEEPRIRGHYGYDTPAEIERIDKECPTLTRIWEDYEIVPESNATNAGSSVDQQITCQLPVRSYTILAVNNDAKELGFNSNYTMNPIDAVNGRNPVKQQQPLANMTTPRTEPTDDSYIALDAWYNGRSYSDRPGFNTSYFDKDSINPQALSQTRSFIPGYRIKYNLNTALSDETASYACMIIYRFYRSVTFAPGGIVTVQKTQVAPA